MISTRAPVRVRVRCLFGQHLVRKNKDKKKGRVGGLYPEQKKKQSPETGVEPVFLLFTQLTSAPAGHRNALLLTCECSVVQDMFQQCHLPLDHSGLKL